MTIKAATLVYNDSLDKAQMVSGSTTIILAEDGAAGVPEAPQDGNLYGRKDATWEVVPTSGVAQVLTDTTTARTLSLTDSGKYIRSTNTSATAFTVPPQSSVTWLDDTEVHIRRAVTGDLTLTPGSGVTLNVPYGGSLLMTSGMTVTLKRVASDVWDVIGFTKSGMSI